MPEETAELPFQLLSEDVPDVTRRGQIGREPVKWEQLLDPVRQAPPKPDGSPQSFRLWTYDSKSKAAGRKGLVTKRLNEAVPQENWFLTAREVPGSDGKEFGVWAEFRGLFTDEELKTVQQKRAERNEKIRKAREAANEANSTVPDTTSSETGTSAASKVKAAAGKK